VAPAGMVPGGGLPWRQQCADLLPERGDEGGQKTGRSAGLRLVISRTGCSQLFRSVTNHGIVHDLHNLFAISIASLYVAGAAVAGYGVHRGVAADRQAAVRAARRRQG
jgi:hypothetical protein